MLTLMALFWAGSSATASAHERWYEFDDTHVAISIERFMGVDYTDFEGPGGGDVSARLLLNADEPVPTSYGRFGIDVFIERLSLGVAGGVTSEDTAILAPRVGYMFGLAPQLGLWLRAGGFYATTPAVDYVGITAEALLAWFPYSAVAITLGPTLDLAFADEDSRAPDYVSIGIPEVGLSVFF
jgi:hypothetical protein